MSSANKRYYWIKLYKDFFKRPDIKIIEAMPNGVYYVNFYLKLLLESVDNEGELRFNDAIPYNEQMLAVITNTNVDIVRSAVKVFKELGMLEILDDETIYMTEVAKLIGSESAVAERVRRHRAKKEKQAKKLPAGNNETPKMLQSNTEVTRSNAAETKRNTEIDIEIDTDKELDIEREGECERESGAESEAESGLSAQHSPESKKAEPDKTKRFIKPSVDEVREYCLSRGNGIDAQVFVDFYESKGWLVGKTPMKDWKAAVRTWEKRDNRNAGYSARASPQTAGNIRAAPSADDYAEQAKKYGLNYVSKDSKGGGHGS